MSDSDRNTGFENITIHGINCLRLPDFALSLLLIQKPRVLSVAVS